jgi:hypothetical protein
VVDNQRVRLARCGLILSAALAMSALVVFYFDGDPVGESALEGRYADARLGPQTYEESIRVAFFCPLENTIDWWFYFLHVRILNFTTKKLRLTAPTFEGLGSGGFLVFQVSRISDPSEPLFLKC